ncbi:Mu-like prophage major head subunit gpT family protein [Sandaracinus amylolyticus]|uniref:Putative major head subunit protein n=1 Tax=Sandaracinus amylolyticus TaxID=927083 RepID=A0A0F6W2Z3_9BACT|nr:Mu-like prophage major head subunit gpT family protein [Sandaracinus amylolyticus]AKF06073.1 putative major head subunit protein [Sandaracinus amylolyticus]
MSALTPAFLFDLESNMRTITTNEFARLTRNLWWNKIAKRIDSKSKKERIAWLLETAKIERTIKGGGQMVFEDIVGTTTEFENENAVAGLKLKKEQLEDHDGNGVQLATHWSKQVGALAAYWPQEVVANAIKANPVTYDGLAFFHNAHPVNPFASEYGTYANLFTGAAAGVYPGALPIDASVTVEVALANLQKAIAYIGSIKMPNGKNPRKLRVSAIIVPPALMARAVQLTNAKLIVQSAATGALAGDVEAVIQYMALGQPIQAEEFGANFGGSDTDYYLACEEITSDELGAFVYVDREPFQVVYHGPLTDAELARMRELQWTTEGRNTVGPGHPYQLFKCRAT